jgi:hypothetical protein
MNPIGCAGQARRSSPCMAQSLRSGVSPKAHVVQEGPPRRPVETTRVLIAVWRACADCFRSQLRRLGFGQPTRRDPGEAVRTYHEGLRSTLKIGTFYFGGNRNFLLWSDITPKLCNWLLPVVQDYRNSSRRAGLTAVQASISAVPCAKVRRQLLVI